MRRRMSWPQHGICGGCLAILIVFMLFCGFEWPWAGKKQAEESRASNRQDEKSSGQQAEGETVGTPETPAAARTVMLLPTPVNPAGEVAQIQKELAVIAQQSRVLQVQGSVDRAQLQKVVDQMKIQKQLLTTLEMPQQVATKQNVNREQIIRDTKIRLIGNEVKRTRETLQALNQPTKTPTANFKTPVAVKKSPS